MKRAKPKRKPRRVVLGVGHPWFSIAAVWMGESEGMGKPEVILKRGSLGNWNRIRLVAEVLK